MNPESSNCLTVGAFDPYSSPDKIVAWADEIIVKDVCDHVGSCKLMSGEAAIYAILDVACFAPLSLRAKCQRPTTSNLFLESKNEIKTQKEALNVLVDIEAIPSESLSFVGVKSSHGKSIVEVTWHEVPRSYHRELPPWRRKYPMTIRQGEALVPASIAVHIKAQHVNSQRQMLLRSTSSLNLIVRVPPLQKEVPTMPSNSASSVLEESLKLLLLHGMSVLDAQLPPGSRNPMATLVLNVGRDMMTESDLSDTAVESAIRRSAIGDRLGETKRVELDSINRKLTSLSESHRILDRITDSAATTVDKGRALAEVAQQERDIAALQTRLWNILKATGSFSIDQLTGERLASKQISDFVSSAKSRSTTDAFLTWAGSNRPTLAIVFTDIVNSTALGESLKDETMRAVRAAHFAQSRKLIKKYSGFEIKTIGDSFMVVFKSAEYAFDFARELCTNTGEDRVQIRAGIHIGPLDVEGFDVFGGEVNFAARVAGAIKGAGLWASEELKRHLDRLGSPRHAALEWERQDGISMKGFGGTYTLWSLRLP